MFNRDCTFNRDHRVYSFHRDKRVLRFNVWVLVGSINYKALKYVGSQEHNQLIKGAFGFSQGVN